MVNKEFNDRYSDMWNELYKKQKGICICCHENEGTKVDIDWDEELVFGLTCFDCYCILSTANENQEYLKLILKYLKRKDKIYAENEL